MTFTVSTDDDTNIVIPIISEPQTNTISLPARCETFRMFHLENFSEPVVIPAQEIASGVFIPNTVVFEKNPIVRVLNTTTQMKLVENKIKHVHKATDYEFYEPKPSVNNKNNERIELLSNYLSKTPKYAQRELSKLCIKYADVFHLPGDQMTTNNFYEQKLRMKQEDSIYVKPYRLPQTQKQEINSQVQKLLDNKLIEPSVSSFNSPLILVPKKSQNGQKKWRMCVDYRMLNKNLVADKFPLPRIDDILDNLGRARYFSVLDLYSGFHQIPLAKESREMTAFSTEKGSFQFTVVPFGLNVAPNSFSRMMSLAFSGLPPNAVFIYMDDIVVIGNSINNHLDNLENVFKVCRKYNLKLNPEKCDFFRPEVTFLGHICSEKGIKPDSKKLEAIDKYPKPIDKESTRRFTAFANYYRRFIPHFAEIVRPLNILQKKNTPFVWTDECEKSFEKLKYLLKTPPILAYPDWEKDFWVTVDSSIFACGGVLSQIVDGNDRPISYISKTYKKGELNKPIIEKELLAIHFAITTLRPYLYGKRFTVRSDHRPLVYLYNMKDPASKLVRIRLDLEEYNFDIIYIKGKDNVVADALSRISIDDLKAVFEENKSVLVLTRAQARKALNNDDKNSIPSTNEVNKPKVYEEIGRNFDKKVPRIKCTLDNSKLTLRAFLKHQELFNFDISSMADGGKISFESICKALEREASARKIKYIQLPKDDKLLQLYDMNEIKSMGEKYLRKLHVVLINTAEKIVDSQKKLELIKRYHDDPIFGGHMGQKKLYEKLRSAYYWKNMHRDIAKFVKQCEKCALCKPKHGVKVPMKITHTPQRPFDVVIIDTIGPLPKSHNGNQYAVTLVCDLTKYLVTIPISDKSANTVAKAIFTNFILVYGPMQGIRTDNGTEYKNSIISELCQLLNVKHDFSVPYRHESVGSIERNHRFFNEYIRAYVNNVSEWEDYLRYFTFCYNISTHTSFDDKFTPYELIFSRKANLPFNLVNNQVDPIYNIENYAKEAKFRLQTAHKLAGKIIEKCKLKNKHYYDKTAKNLDLSINDKVYMQVQPYDKHKPVYAGPFLVKSISDTNVEIYDPVEKKSRVIHKNQIRI